MRILVTGHEGFEGRNMMAALHAEENWQIAGWSFGSDLLPNVNAYDWVIHLDSDLSDKDVDKSIERNLEFSQWIFKECNSNGVNLQYSSTCKVYGNSKDFSEHSPCYPQTPYAWSKYLFDRWVFQQDLNIYVQGFRHFTAYGKWQHLQGLYANSIHKWRTQARKEGRITAWENAENIKRDYVWIGDICRLHIDFIKTVKGSGIWNVGSGLAHTVLDIAEEIAEQENVPLELIPMPDESRRRLRTKTCANLSHLKETIGKRKWLNVFEYLNQ